MIDFLTTEANRLFELYRSHDYAPIVLSIVLVIVVRLLARRFLGQWGAPELAGRGRVRIVTMAIYPVKSCAGVAVQRWKLGKRGLIDDRHWMVVDSAGRFVSQREQPRLALVQPAYSDDFQTLILSSPACATPLRIDRKAPASGAKVTVTLWDDELSVREESAACHAWFAEAIGVPGVRLVRIAPEHRRTLDARHAVAPTADGAIAFPDSAPFLVISRQSLAELERQLPENRKRCADLRRFRPNIVVDGAHGPHEEDNWSKIAIGANADAPVVLHAAKQCTRCRLTTCDPDAGTMGGDGEEPLSTLRRYRAPVTEDGARSLVPVFGLHFLHDWQKDVGKTIGIGDVVVPLATRTPETLAPPKPVRDK
jgi:uncharacterized protein YcbX